MRNHTDELRVIDMAQGIVLKPSHFSLAEIQTTVQELLDIIEEGRK